MGHKRLEYLGVEKMEGREACTATSSSSSSRNSATAEEEQESRAAAGTAVTTPLVLPHSIFCPMRSWF